MVYIEWSQDMETGFGIIDAQHKGLVVMINEIAAVLEGSAPADSENGIEANLRKLLEYTIVHFELEESLLLDARFEGYAEHKADHDEFRARMHDYFSRFRAGEDVAMQLLSELRVWLVQHILGTDMKYIETVKRNIPLAALEA